MKAKKSGIQILLKGDFVFVRVKAGPIIDTLMKFNPQQTFALGQKLQDAAAKVALDIVDRQAKAKKIISVTPPKRSTKPKAKAVRREH